MLSALDESGNVKFPKYTNWNYTIGDLNADKAVDAKDATMILISFANSILSKEADTGINREQTYVGDVNSDGATDSKDATCILVYYAHSISDDSFGSFEDYIKTIKS